MRHISLEDLVRRYHSGEGFVVFDTETTGLNTYHDDIIEIGAMVWEKGKDPVNFQELIKVNTAKISPEAWAVHQIPEDEILAARNPEEVLKDFIDWTENRSIIAHNAKFDYDFLNSNLIKAGMKPYQNDDVACTLVYAREQGKPGKLGELAKHYNVSVEGDNLHRALYDVQVLMEVLNKIMAENEPEEMQYSLVF